MPSSGEAQRYLDISVYPARNGVWISEIWVKIDADPTDDRPIREADTLYHKSQHMWRWRALSRARAEVAQYFYDEQEYQRRVAKSERFRVDL